MNREQVENIDSILKEVNATGRINKKDVYKMFKYREDAISTLRLLDRNRHINIIEIEEGDGIHAIISTDNTFDGIGYYLRFLEEESKAPIETKTATKIATIISGLSKSLILQIVIPIIVGLIILIVWSLCKTNILSWFN